MRTDTGNRIARIIAEHLGRENAISSERIARRLSWFSPHAERHVRRIIADEAVLWCEMEVCELPGHGFFVPTEFDDVMHCVHWLDQQAANAAEKARLKREYFRARGWHVPEFGADAAPTHVAKSHDAMEALS